MTQEPPASRRFHFSTRVGPQWGNVDRLRTAVLDQAQSTFGPGDLGEIVSTVMSELLENAVKYGDWRPPDRAWLGVAVVGERRSFRITVESPIDEGSEHIVRLRRMLRWIESFPSPRDAYLARVKELGEGGDDTTGGMGLVRVACEGPCRLEATVLEGGWLSMSAVVHLVARRDPEANG